MIGWHHQLNGYEFEQTLEDVEGQGGLACCGPWGHKESDTTEQLNNKLPSLIVSAFSVVMYGCESWTIKKAECRRKDAFELWCRRRLL